MVDDRAGSDREVLADTQGALLDLREHPPLKRTSTQVAAQAQYQARAAAFEGTFERGRITEQDIGSASDNDHPVSKNCSSSLFFHAGGLRPPWCPVGAQREVGLHDAVVDGVVGDGGIGEAPVAFFGLNRRAASDSEANSPA